MRREEIREKMELEEEAKEEMGLVGLCIKAATESKESIEKWRRQRRTLEKMPTPLAQALLLRLLSRRLLSPSLLEVFQHSIERINLSGENFVDAEWMAYVGAFRYLHTLNIADCRSIDNSSLWPITGMDSLKELDISRCTKVTDAGIGHLLSISKLEKLHLSETGLTVNGVKQLSSLRNLTLLDLGGLPVTDLALSSLQVLTNLEYLDLWGSQISNNATTSLKMFPKLSVLNLAWTEVTEVPNMPSLTCLNMSNCTIHSIFREECDGDRAPRLAKLHLAGTIITDLDGAFSYIKPSDLFFLDLSNSSLDNFWFLAKTSVLKRLDLSFTRMGDDSVELVACVGVTLRSLNLSNTRLSSAGVGILAGNVPNLESLFLSQTAIDDVALSYIGMMPCLKVIDLSNTNIRGFLEVDGSDRILSLAALQSLNHLERLYLEETRVRTELLEPLSCLPELKILSLKSDFLIDYILHISSSLLKLKFLGICGAVLTNDGLRSFNPPPMLEILDLRDCWLLTRDDLSSFCRRHPKIEIRHEYAQNSSTNRNARSHSPTTHGTSRSLKFRQKRGKTCLALGEENFVDERLKYSRQELLELQFSALSLVPSHGNSLQDSG